MIPVSFSRLLLQTIKMQGLSHKNIRLLLKQENWRLNARISFLNREKRMPPLFREALINFAGF
ncbi:MAG TPA: hypothetical protein VEV87_02015 [Chitinophagaceae bacterium]|nr:hypothetical protein [Chitinophagaceae bacterium]